MLRLITTTTHYYDYDLLLLRLGLITGTTHCLTTTPSPTPATPTPTTTTMTRDLNPSVGVSGGFPIFNQGHLGSCTANALAAAFHFTLHKMEVENHKEGLFGGLGLDNRARREIRIPMRSKSKDPQ